ncbi:MAG: hypothetical protein JXJ04_19105 [Spirochaetales bacterium]|nr:hypothetical protein [Spirochaetales bacterium]
MDDKNERQKYSDMLMEQGYLNNSHDLVIREDFGEKINKTASPEQKDVSPFIQMCMRIMKNNSRCNVILFSKKQFTHAVAKSGRKLYPLLDDVAQLTGRAVRCIDSLHSIKKGLLTHNALFVRNEGCLCMAHDLYEAHALAMVIEKASGAHIAGFFLGGGIPIKAHEAALMRLIYVFKYSKKRK